MERATKFFNSFDEGIREVMSVSESIKQWLTNQEEGYHLKLNKPVTEKDVAAILAQRVLLDRPTQNREDWDKELISITAFGVSFESKDYLMFEWRVSPRTDSEEVEYYFGIGGYYLNDSMTLKENIIKIGGWKFIQE